MGARPRAYDGAGVVLRPSRAVVTEVLAESLLAPVGSAGRRDRREHRDRAVILGPGEADDERAVPAHRVAADRLARGIDGQGRVDHLDELPGDVVEHSIMGRPGRLGRVNVESRAGADVEFLVLARRVRVARARVGNDQGDPVLGGVPLSARLDAEVLLRASQAREPIQRGDAPAFRRGGQVDGEPHRAVARLGLMPVSSLTAFEAT